jgi:hypothetical protein
MEESEEEKGKMANAKITCRGEHDYLSTGKELA